MQINRNSYNLGSVMIPSVTIVPPKSLGQILLLHGYGGNKEEMIGLAFRLAESHYTCTAIDMRGHGENAAPYNDQLLDDANRILALFPGTGRRIALGHSLGGRLALLTQANLKIGISPALAQFYAKETRDTINTMRQQKVHEIDPGTNFNYLSRLPLVDGQLTDADLVLYAQSEIPEIEQAIQRLPASFKNIRMIERVMHGDIFLDEQAIQAVLAHLATHNSEAGTTLSD